MDARPNSCHGYGNGGFRVNFTFLIFQYTFYNELYNINSLILGGKKTGLFSLFTD